MAWHLETFGFHLKSATCQLSRVAALALPLDGRLKRSSATRTNRIDGSLSRSQMKSGGKQLEGSTRGGGGCAKDIPFQNPKSGQTNPGDKKPVLANGELNAELFDTKVNYKSIEKARGSET
ncbi:GM19444 [Drosophila sechellia]|uniref:GM19444 n=1 Tax=Drosophila sechellia TaxID=7238 RepID=B4I232_DROSE|nr:GM19444 [Drosophila sechellia]